MIRRFHNILTAISILGILIVCFTSVVPVQTYAADRSSFTVENQEYLDISVSGDKSSIDYGANTVTIGATGWSFIVTGTNKTTLTIKNNTSLYKVRLTYTIGAVTSGGSVTPSAISTETTTGWLSYGEAFTVTLTSPKGNKTTNSTITISKIEIEATGYSVTFGACAGGSYTVDYPGLNQTVVSTTDYATSNSAGNAYTLTATPHSGYEFYGWYHKSSGTLVRQSASNYSVTVTAQNELIYPVFRKTGAAMFGILEQPGVCHTYFDSILVKASSGETIYVMESGALVASNSAAQMTLPAGYKLLVPYSSSDKGYFAEESTRDATATSDGATTAYRTLTIPDGTELIVNGAMSVNAMQGAPGPGDTGFVTGQFGHVLLNGSSAKLTVNGTLVCFGYITGTGRVHATSTANVHELFQLRDWRGGTATSTWMNGGYNSFAFSQYFIQNIETTYQLDRGALSYLHAAITATIPIVNISLTSEERGVFIGEGGLFQLGDNSSLVRRYDASEDRIYYDVYGNVSASGIQLKISDYELNSGEYILGIASSMSIAVKGTDEAGNAIHSKAYLTEDLKFLPGSVVTVEENATLEVSDNANLFFYGLNDWVKDGTLANSYFYFSGVPFTEPLRVKFTPSTRGTQAELTSAQLIVNGTLIGNSNIYSTSDGDMSIDKVLSGAGIFINNPAGESYQKVELDEMVNNSTRKIINTVPMFGLLSGVSSSTTDLSQSFGVGTYYGLGASGDNYWYQHVINTEGGTVNITNTNGVAGSTLSPLDARKDSISKIVARVSDGGAITFTAKGYTVTVGGIPVPYVDGTCTLSNITADTTLVLTPCPHSGGSATCQAQAICERCGASYGEKGSHNYTSEVINPSCVDQGYTKYHCGICGDEYKDTYVTATGHTPVVDAAVAATCTSTGLTEGSHCGVCKATITAQTVVEKLPHTEQIVPAVDPTCTGTGLSEGKKCSVCNTVLEAQQTVPALGHTEVADAAVDATCDAPGKTAGSHCSVCGTILVPQTEIPALGHTEITLPAVAPTCTQTGLTEGKKCSVCDEVTVPQEVVPATGKHTPVIVPAVDPTCTVDGKTEGSKCSVCGETLTAQESIPALGHTPIVDPKVDPTCTETGLTEGSHCGVCGEIIVAQEEIPALGHKWENGTCSVCGEVCSHPDENGDGTCDTCNCAHIYTSVVTDPTCTKNGYTTHTCSVCGHSYIETSDAPLKEHTPGVAATCDTDQTCTVCGTVLVAATGHNYSAAVTAPTCTEAGFTTYTCSKCNDSYIADEIDALGHTAGSTVIENKTGYVCTGFTYDEVVYCTVCTGEISRIKKTANAIANHSYESVVTLPTCTEQGYTTHTCTVCKDEITDSYTAASGHSHGDWEITTKATITSPAVETRKCHCGDTQTQSVKESASVKNPDSEEVKNYLTLSEALGEAAEGATVTLLTDIDGAVSINQVVTIELGSYSATITAAKGYTYAEQNNGKTVVIGKASLSIGATNIKAGDSLDLFFYVRIDSLGDSTDYKAVITRTKGKTPETRTETVVEIPYSKWAKYSNTYMRFCYDGIAAKEMGDPVTVVICKGDGTPLSSAYTQSIQGYAMNMLGKSSSSDALKTALVDMLNYGAAAQNHFGYMTSALANSRLTEEQKALGTQADPTCVVLDRNATNFVQASISVENHLVYTFYFKDIDPNTAEATAVYTDHYGNEKKQVITSFRQSTVEDSGTQIPVYGVDVTGIAVADGRSHITCTVTQGEAVVAKATSSIEDYLAAAQSQLNDPVFMALMKFVDSAKAYFDSLSNS